MNDTIPATQTLFTVSQAILRHMKSRLHTDAVCLEPPQDNAAYTFLAITRASIAHVVASRTPWIIRSTTEKLIDQILFQTCGMDAEDWIRTPGRTRDDIDAALERTLALAQPITSEEASQRAASVFRRMAELFKNGTGWHPGDRAYAMTTRPDGTPVTCPTGDSSAQAWTTPGAYERALDDVCEDLDVAARAYVEVACHETFQKTTGQAELEDADGWQPYTWTNTRELLHRLTPATP